jgi:hypothetical protein
MVDGTMESSILIRRTIVTAGAMLGVCVGVVGTLTLVAVLVVGHVVGSPSPSGSAAGEAPTGVRVVPVGMATAAAPTVQGK